MIKFVYDPFDQTSNKTNFQIPTIVWKFN